jgi:hypothetical protein
MSQEIEKQEALDRFGKQLMHLVRDLAIRYGDQIVGGTMKGERYHRVYARYFSQLDEPQREGIHRLIPKIVDEVLHLLVNLLDSADNLILLAKTESGETFELRKASEEFPLELYGWIARFSQERSNTFQDE